VSATAGGLFGTLVSAAFLFLIGLLNLVVLAGIVRIFTAMRRGEYDEAELERQLENRGLFYRFFGRWMTAISREWQLYPVGVLFGREFYCEDGPQRDRCGLRAGYPPVSRPRERRPVIWPGAGDFGVREPPSVR